MESNSSFFHPFDATSVVEGFTDLFPRSLQLCGGGGDDAPPRDCSNYKGQGQCKSAAGQFYDWCNNNVANAAACRTVAEASEFSVGWEYYGESTTCYILFDNLLSENDVLRFCPSGYTTTNSGTSGTGFPESVETDAKYLCYSCEEL